MQDTLQILDAAAHQLGGRTLSTLAPELEVIAPELQSATRIVFFTSPGIRGLTLAELNLIQSNEALLAKTTFVYGGF
jgi:hypothetical protein